MWNAFIWVRLMFYFSFLFFVINVSTKSASWLHKYKICCWFNGDNERPYISFIKIEIHGRLESPFFLYSQHSRQPKRFNCLENFYIWTLCYFRCYITWGNYNTSKETWMLFQDGCFCSGKAQFKILAHYWFCNSQMLNPFFVPTSRQPSNSSITWHLLCLRRRLRYQSTKSPIPSTQE